VQNTTSHSTPQHQGLMAILELENQILGNWRFVESGELWSIHSLGSSGETDLFLGDFFNVNKQSNNPPTSPSLNFIATLSVIPWNESGTFRGILPTVTALIALPMTPQIESSFRSERQHNFGVYLSIFSDGWRKSYVEGLPSFVCCT
jgi:hypothetical protein